MILGVVEVFILAWAAGATIAAIYNITAWPKRLSHATAAAS
jgi:hypothetical protein